MKLKMRITILGDGGVGGVEGVGEMRDIGSVVV